MAVALALVAFGYVLGCLPSGVLLARRAGVDPRRAGSGNVGATNVARTAGLRLGLLTLVADVAKGAVAAAVGAAVATRDVAAVSGVAAVLGHVYPASSRFRGGKGVATALGVLLVLSPAVAAAAVAVFAVTLATDRRVSVASLAAAAAATVAATFLHGGGIVLAATATIAIVVAVRHRDNVERIRAGTEPRL